jgi:hypothetical protein
MSKTQTASMIALVGVIFGVLILVLLIVRAVKPQTIATVTGDDGKQMQQIQPLFSLKKKA